MLYNYSMKRNVGYIKETELNYFDDEQSNNIIDVNDEDGMPYTAGVKDINRKK